MPIARSLRRKVMKCESAPEQKPTAEKQIDPVLAPVTASVSVPAIAPVPITPVVSVQYKEGSVSLKSRSAKSGHSKKGIQRAEALERLAQAKLVEARAAAALAEAEVARIDAQSTDAEDEESIPGADKDRTILVKSWLDTQQKMVTSIDHRTIDPHKREYTDILSEHPVQHTNLAPQGSAPQMIDITALAAALTEAARTSAMHAPMRYLQELPYFSGASSEWLAFRAAYRDTHSHFSKAENLARLRRCLRGVAKEAAISLFIAETEPGEVMHLLELRFGRPDALVIAEMEKIKALPRLTDNPRDICVFSSRIINIVTVVKALNKIYYLYNPEAVRAVVEKMTPAIKYRWYDFAVGRPEDEPDLIKLSSFLSREADLCSRYAQVENIRGSSSPPQRKSHQAYSITPTKSSPRSSIQKSTSSQACPLCTGGHDIGNCEAFKELSVTDRWQKSKDFNICFRCLIKRSFRHQCKYKACGIEECKGSHHPLLHSLKETSLHPAVVTSTRPITMNRAFLKIIPVRVRGPTSTIETFALLDEGSTVTMIEDDVARAVGATGPREPFDIEGVAGARVSANSSMRVSLNISGRNSDKEHEIAARTIDQLHLAPQSIDETVMETCLHLHQIANDLMYHRGTPTLLIGQDNWNLIVSKSVRSGARGQPAASLTELGWVLHGPSESRSHRIHFVSKVTVHSNDEEERIEELMKNFFDLDSIGIEPKRPKNDPHERALAVLERRSHRLPDGRFETGLLWKNDEVVLPDNKDSAMKRLQGIERKLDKNTDLKKQYSKQIKHLIESGYAEVAPSSTRPGRTWYLPHFAVVNPSKPKPRIVLDAAAKTNGISLNDLLLTGPDLLQSLPGVLMRFRQRRFAVTGDIQEMFLRISMREEDRDALRFLWRDDRREGPPTEYRMSSVIFGAASSPCTAIYIKNRNAEEHRSEFPAAADAINKNHYMDDYIQSFNSREDAIRIATDVDYVHRQAKFYLQKWASNCPEIITAIAPEQKSRDNEVKLQDNPLSATEKTLGLVWRSHENQLAFNLDLKKVDPEVVNGLKRPTKRESLRVIMSLFDPLGLVTPVTLPAKHMLQNTWRLGIGWDDELPNDRHTRWLEWLCHMKQLRRISLPRCYPHYATAVHLEMHIFVDASESACVAAVYWRAITERATVHVSLVMAKGKVAPLKTTSIPRLELQAAVLGCRLARTIEREHDLKPARRVFWTDSRIVLAWLRNGPRTYKPFVAHRVAEVEEETKVNEWRWVPTSLNVADDATRDTPSIFDNNHRWFRGPDFLYHSEESWPREPEPTELPTTGEERVATTTRGSSHIVEVLPEAARFSSWMRLVRSTGRVLQFIELCRAKQTIAAANIKRTCRSNSDGPWKPTTSRRPIAQPRTLQPVITTTNYVALETHHVQAAEKLWWRASQEESFQTDLYRLRKNLLLERDSKLRMLSVILDDEGIIRLKSRIDSASHISEAQRSPPILDGGNAYTRLYITWIHRQNHHAGTETVVNEIRSRLWVLRLRPTARSIVKSCIKCRILRAKPASPATGDHPSTRLAHHKRPFSYVGLDYFGPCSVTVGRHHEKRYVALFTCLTTRAVHVEVAGSLNTDSAIMALRRMMARRGCPTEIHSDNGTNLRGADAELRRAAYQATKNEGTTRTIRWRYIPPGSPFMGGAWERLVQTVKRALAATLNERHPTEEVLLTLLLEVEYTVNNRPLTPVSTSEDDMESLTPLHFILGGPARVPLPGSFTDFDMNAKQRWRHTQRLADIFWTRWVKEYLPLLQYRREPRSRGNAPQIGDVVLLIDENLPRNVWPRGQITATYPGKDGIVRVVEVRIKTGHLRRAVKKVVVLAREDAEAAPAGECARP